MNTHNSVILALVVILLSLAISAFAGGPLYTWTITDIGQAKDGSYTLVIHNQDGNTNTAECVDEDIRGLMLYLGVQKPQELKGKRFSGNDLRRTLETAAQWALHMSPEDKLVEELAKGLITLKSFDLPKSMMLSEKDFIGNQYLRKDLLQKLGERIEVLSNGKFELGGAKPSDFSTLTRSMCFDMLSIVETKSILESVSGICEGQTSKSVIRHCFFLAADCTNAVQFDPVVQVKIDQK